jgi:hypothetical protein
MWYWRFEGVVGIHRFVVEGVQEMGLAHESADYGFAD